MHFSSVCYIAIPVTGCGGLYGCETSRLSQFLGNRLTDGDEVLSSVKGWVNVRREMVGVYSENRTRHINILWNQNSKSLNVMFFIQYFILHVELSGWFISQQWIGKDVQGSARGLTAVLAQHVPRETAENYESPGQSVSRPRFEPDTCRIYVGSVNASANSLNECEELYLHSLYVFMRWCLTKHRD
jgi:hypothetical protein